MVPCCLACVCGGGRSSRRIDSVRSSDSLLVDVCAALKVHVRVTLQKAASMRRKSAKHEI